MSCEEMIETIRSAFPGCVLEASKPKRKRVLIKIKVDRLREVASFLRDELGFDTLVSAGAIDYLDAEVFEIVYYVWSSSKRTFLMLKVNVHRDEPTSPSLTDIWEAVDYHERETWEMFGVDFQDHPNLTKLFLPKDWDNGFPMRKDFEWGSKEEK